MKVILANKHFLGIAGGAERNIADLANWLSMKGHVVYILSESKHGTDPAFPVLPEVRIVNPGLLPPASAEPDFPRDQFDVDLTQWLRDSRALRRKWAKSIREIDPDVIVTFLPHTSTFLLYELRDEYPIIVTNQSTPDVIYYPEKAGADPVDLYLRRELLKYAHKVHFLIPEFVRKMPEFVAQRSIIIPNAVQPQRTGGHLPTKTIVSVGRLVPDKDFSFLIDAFCQSEAFQNGWQLHIFGRGPEEDALRLRIRKHMAQQKVLLRGFTTSPQAEMFKSAMFVIPSRYEGWGLALTEAMSVGLPCIGIEDCTGVNWLIESEQTGFLVSRSPTSLAQAIDRLATDGTLREKLGTAAKESIKRFHPEKVYAIWEDAIETAARRVS